MSSPLDFENVVQDYYRDLYHFAFSLARSPSEASDLVQETFYIWAAKGHQLSDPKKVRTWLFTTLHREFLGKRRRLARFPHHELGEVEAELPDVAPPTPNRLDWSVLAECMMKVDPVFQAPVALFYLEDYSYDEIAAILEVPLGTVKSRISRGIGQLQQMFAQQARTAERTRQQNS